MNASDEPSNTAQPEELPVLTQVIEVHDELPMLTEVVQAPPATPALELELVPELEFVPEPSAEPEPSSPPAPARKLSDEEIQLLLKHLETRLEVIFTQKLSLHLEKLQRLAVKQAVNEFRASLPELVREILDAPPERRP